MSATPFQDLDSGFRWLESFTNLETIRASRDRQLYRLDRMRYLLDRYGNPHRSFPTIHVAGSKGKGSTATLIASALRQSGHRTGLYTSPHVSSYAERILVDGLPADEHLLLRLMVSIRETVDGIPAGTLPVSPAPTTFELLTLLGFLVFRESGCTAAVIEVGIGGRLDATNVVLPVASVITLIELEHTEILGDTLTEIAREKGGIIKDGVPVFSAPQRPEVRAELARIATLRRAPITFLDEAARISDVAVSARGTTFLVRASGTETRLSLGLVGSFQAENATLALLVLRALDNRPDEAAIRRGFARAALPGRMELMRTTGDTASWTVVLDGAHTPASVARAAQGFLEVFPSGGVLLFGSVSGKRTEEMASILAPLFRSVVISRPNPFKESDPQAVFEAFRGRHPSCRLEVDPQAALRAACEAAGPGVPVLVTGSFYMISEIRRLLVPLDPPDLLAGRLTVVTGDITDMQVDAIVNAANSSLAGGGGVDGAIHRAGGPSILAECQAIRKSRYPDGLPPGQAVVTGGGRLPARSVIHTVGPVYRGGGAAEATELRSAYLESLARAAEIGARTVAFPAISTGVYGYPKEEAARVAHAAIAEHLASSALPERVILVFFTQADADTFVRAATPV